MVNYYVKGYLKSRENLEWLLEEAIHKFALDPVANIKNIYSTQSLYAIHVIICICI